MNHNLLVTKVGSQIIVAELSFEERTKILGRANFCGENFYLKRIDIGQKFTCSEIEKAPHWTNRLETEFRSGKMWTVGESQKPKSQKISVKKGTSPTLSTPT